MCRSRACLKNAFSGLTEQNAADDIGTTDSICRTRLMVTGRIWNRNISPRNPAGKIGFLTEMQLEKCGNR